MGVFLIFGQFFKKENRTVHDIDMKLGPVTKRDNRNSSMLKKFNDDVNLANFDVIIFFLIYGQFTDIRKPDSGRMVYKTYILINKNFLSCKTSKQN